MPRAYGAFVSPPRTPPTPPYVPPRAVRSMNVGQGILAIQRKRRRATQGGRGAAQTRRTFDAEGYAASLPGRYEGMATSRGRRVSYPHKPRSLYKKRGTFSGRKGGGGRSSWRMLARRYPQDKFYRRYYPRTAESAASYGGTWGQATAVQRALRDEERMFGRGIYTGTGAYSPFLNTVGNVAKAAWKHRSKWLTPALDIGAFAGNTFLPNPAWGLGRMALRATGIGPYEASMTVANKLVSAGHSSGQFVIPKFNISDDAGSITISNHEFVGNLYAPGTSSAAAAFASQTFKLNPGLGKVFPWLSAVAKNYTSYELKQCIVSVKSLITAPRSESGLTGSVALAHQTNSYAEPFVSQSEMQKAFGTVSGKSTQNFLLGVECDPALLPGEEHKYIRFEDIPPGTGRDHNDFDHGVVTVATSACPPAHAGQRLAEIWISYTVTLFRPKVEVGTGATISQDQFMYMRNADTSAPELPCWNSQAAPTGESQIWPKITDGIKSVFNNVSNGLGVKVEGLDVAETLLLLTPGAGLVAFLGGTHITTGPGSTGQCAVKITFPGNFAGDVVISYLCRTNQTDNATIVPPTNPTMRAVNMEFTEAGLYRDANCQVDALNNIPALMDSEGAYIPAKGGMTCFTGQGIIMNADVVANPGKVNMGIRMLAMVTVRPSIAGKDNVVYLICTPEFLSGSPSTFERETIIEQASLTVSLHNDTLSTGGLGMSFTNGQDERLIVTAPEVGLLI